MSNHTDDCICDRCGAQFKESSLKHTPDPEGGLDVTTSPCCDTDYEYFDSIVDRCLKAKHAIVILETCKREMVEGMAESAQYVPCVVSEGESGYLTTSWLWGNDFEVAKSIADEYNAKAGLTPDDVFVLVAQSMRQEDSPYYGNMAQMVALAKEYGLDGVNFAQFWQMRFPDHGTSYMEDWARRLRDGNAREQADNQTLHALEKCGLLE